MNEFRGFIAVEIPISEKLKALYNALNKLSIKIKLVSLENIHITLKFLGQTKFEQVKEIETIMKNATCDVDPFSIILQGTGVFPNRKYIKVIWVGITGATPLASLSRNIDRHLKHLGFPEEKRAFSPHMTLGRVKFLKDKEPLLSILDEYKDEIFSEVPINAILLKKSTLTPSGPIYETISKVIL
jgi:RNA 2',3'-cyclic 3'-phosphodiesterase